MKENDKVLISKLLLKATFVLLVISVFLKLCGLNVFGADTSNAVLISISNFIDKYNLKNPLDLCLLFIQIFLIYKIICKSKNIKSFIVYSSITTITIYLSQHIIFDILFKNNILIQNIIYILICGICIIGFPIIIDKKEIKKNNNLKSYYSLKILIKKSLITILLINIYQFIILFLRSITLSAAAKSLYDILLNFDYIILLLSTYYLSLRKQTHMELNSWFEFNITNLLNEQLSFDEIKAGIIKFQEFKKKFKESSKVDKITIVLYIIFSTLSEIINVSLVIFIAYLNNVLIECLFIITSFLISRQVFGAFHLKSAIQCWMLSNISFYLLSKLTINIGLTYVVPILCGIALSYITSKFIKQTNKNLYKGIPERDLLELVQNKNLTELELAILKKYYCEGINIDKMTFIYHYSRAQLYRYKANAEKKINSQ